VGEVHNDKIYEKERLGKIEGIHLPMLDKKQIIAQYVDDTSFTLRAFREGMTHSQVPS